MALENGIHATNTNSRMRELKKLKIVDDSFCDALEEAFDTLLNLRLQERLRYFEHEEDPDNHIDIKNLNQLELELLKDSFKIINKFKDFLTHHFKLSMVQ